MMKRRQVLKTLAIAPLVFMGVVGVAKAICVDPPALYEAGDWYGTDEQKEQAREGIEVALKRAADAYSLTFGPTKFYTFLPGHHRLPAPPPPFHPFYLYGCAEVQ